MSQDSSVDWKYFLEAIPPGKHVAVQGIKYTKNTGHDYIALPELQLHCITESCSGVRYFSGADGEKYLATDKTVNSFLVYVCRNCRRHVKTFAVAVRHDQSSGAWVAFKYGETPSFGPPTPARAIKLIGPDRDLFLLGRRCENQGMGIGAFVYYRRVVENQKNRIFDEIIRVTNAVAPDLELVEELEAAKNETQFSKAVESIKHAIPQSILVNRYNPLTLLHSALSEGVHAHEDAECLEIATSIRVVLVEFADRMAQVLKDEAELNSAVSRLANARR